MCCNRRCEHRTTKEKKTTGICCRFDWLSVYELSIVVGYVRVIFVDFFRTHLTLFLIRSNLYRCCRSNETQLSHQKHVQMTSITFRISFNLNRKSYSTSTTCRSFLLRFHVNMPKAKLAQETLESKKSFAEKNKSKETCNQLRSSMFLSIEHTNWFFVNVFANSKFSVYECNISARQQSATESIRFI